jgi:hypothetical protein
MTSIVKASGFFAFPCQPKRRVRVYSLYNNSMSGSNAMSEPIFKVPVTCPHCALESVSAMSIALIANALLTGKAIRLHSTCHDQYWTATYAERQQLRRSLAVLNIEGHAQPSPVRAGRLESDSQRSCR